MTTQEEQVDEAARAEVRARLARGEAERMRHRIVACRERVETLQHRVGRMVDTVLGVTSGSVSRAVLAGPDAPLSLAQREALGLHFRRDAVVGALDHVRHQIANDQHARRNVERFVVVVEETSRVAVDPTDVVLAARALDDARLTLAIAAEAAAEAEALLTSAATIDALDRALSRPRVTNWALADRIDGAHRAVRRFSCCLEAVEVEVRLLAGFGPLVTGGTAPAGADEAVAPNRFIPGEGTLAEVWVTDLFEATDVGALLRRWRDQVVELRHRLLVEHDRVTDRLTVVTARLADLDSDAVIADLTNVADAGVDLTAG